MKFSTKTILSILLIYSVSASAEEPNFNFDAPSDAATIGDSNKPIELKIDRSRNSIHALYGYEPVIEEDPIARKALAAELATRKAMPDDQIEYRSFRVPLPVDQNDFPLIETAAAAMLLAFPIDKKIVDSLSQPDHSPIRNRLAKYGKNFGANLGLAAAGASMLYTFQKDQPESLELISREVEAIFIVGIVNNELKVLFRRSLPDDASGNWSKGKSKNPSRLEFPSGHTTLAVTAATIIDANTKDQPWIGTVAYLSAGVTAWSRIHDNQHYLTGVLASIYSHYLTRAIISPDRTYSRNIEIRPYVNRAGPGLQFVYHEHEERVFCSARRERTIEQCIQETISKMRLR